MRTYGGRIVLATLCVLGLLGAMRFTVWADQEEKEETVSLDRVPKAVKAAIVPPQKDSRYKAAYFLLIPGASKVYANYIRRLDKKGKARASR